MDTTQIHLMLNHIPVLLSVTGGMILLFGLIRENKTGINIALYLLIISALFTLPVYFTGEGTEESVENLPGVSKSLIEQHENMALISFVFIGVTGVLALISFILKKRSVMSAKISIVALIFAFISFGTFTQTAHLGGQIRHTEIRGNSVQNGNNQATETGKQNEKRDDD